MSNKSNPMLGYVNYLRIKEGKNALVDPSDERINKELESLGNRNIAKSTHGASPARRTEPNSSML